MKSEVESELEDVPDKYLVLIAELIRGTINETDTELTEPILKPTIEHIYPIFIIQYSVLAIFGILLNVAIIIYTIFLKLYNDVTHAFIINLSVCHFVQCALVLPITLMIMLIQNWIWGQFLCFFVPMLQDIPLHVVMLTHVLIAWDRMRWLGDPLKGRIPSFVCSCATWLTGMVIALPYPIYTTYLELGTYVSRLEGVGLCFVNLVDDMHEYMRGLFLIMYCGPMTLLAYLYIKTSKELHPPEGPFAVMMFEHRADIRNQQRNSSTSSATGRPIRTDSTRSYDLYNAELDAYREKRLQGYLGSMAATQVICVCPLMILRLAKMVLVETYENAGHFDLTYLMFVWIAFLPTAIFPWIYVTGILSRTEKERLRGYLTFANRRKGMKQMSRSSQEDSGGPESNAEGTQPQKQSHEILKEKKITKEEKIDTADLKRSHSIAKAKPVQNIVVAARRDKLSCPTKSQEIDPVNNSCSNITSSTYCNTVAENGSLADCENSSAMSTDRDSICSTKKWTHLSAMRRNNNPLTDSDTYSRRESSSTLERDMEIIDMLERERSMDISDMWEREKRCEIVRNVSIERRRLPDLEKIRKSPKQDVIRYKTSTSLDNQYQSFNDPLIQPRVTTRKISQSSFGRMYHDSVTSAMSLAPAGEIGLFEERQTLKMSVIENRINRSTRGSLSSTTSSVRSSVHGSSRSRQLPHEMLPPSSIDLDFRENLFADL